jgi:very-short-patch-repair endonuclease
MAKSHDTSLHPIIPFLWRSAAEGGGVMPSRNSRAYAALPFNPALKGRARELRKAGNLAEIVLWVQLKKGQLNGWDFDRQKIIGNYIVDFYCGNCNLVVEVDGASHNNKQEYDAERDAYLVGLGLTVLHFSDIDVLNRTESVVDEIKNYNPARVSGTPSKA